MLENPSEVPIKRYAPPNQRNRSLGRRKSSASDRSERTSNLYSNDLDKNLNSGFRSASIDSSDTGSNKSVYESFHTQLIALNGCCTSEASHILNERWKAAMHCYDDPTVDLSERPVMYTGSGAPAWGSLILPHQLMAGSQAQTDFLVELQRAIHNSNKNLKN